MLQNNKMRRRFSLLDFAKSIILLELIWPLPLLVVGIWSLLNPLLVGAAFLLAIMPWLARLLLCGRPTRPVFIGKAVALFVISALLSTGIAYDPALSWPMLLTLLGSVGLFFAVANSHFPVSLMGAGLVAAAVVMALYFITQYAHFDLSGERGRLAYLGRLTGSPWPNLAFFQPHPNAMAGFLVGPFLLTLSLIRQARGRAQARWGAAGLIIAYGLLISGSRGAWLGLVGATGIWLILNLPNRTIRLAAVGAGAGGVLLAVSALLWFAASGSGLTVLGPLIATATSRWTLYRNSLFLLGDYPFSGIGLGDTFAMVYSRYQLLIQVPFFYYSHNLFLTVALGQGLLGLAALVWLLIGFYRFVARAEAGDLSQRRLFLFRGAWLGVTAIFIHGLTDAPQFAGSGWTMPILFALLGLAVTTGRPALKTGRENSVDLSGEQLRRRRWLRITIPALLLIALLGFFWRPLASAWYANLGAVYHTWSDLSPGLDKAARKAAAQQAKANYGAALNLNPANPVAHRRLGLLALSRNDYETAVRYLEPAYRLEPGNQVTVKALGLAYLWAGRLDSAEPLLRQIKDRRTLVRELGAWQRWWARQQRADLSNYAGEMRRRLLEKRVPDQNQPLR